MIFKIKKKKFNIRFLEGKKFSKKSKDFNPIHINKIYGYNSIFGQNIVHGALTVVFFLKRTFFSKKFEITYIKINFIKPVEYDNYIFIKCVKKNKQNLFFSLFQNKQAIIEINIKLSKLENAADKNYKKKIEKILEKISWYTGMKYPGINSLIYDISIVKNKNIKNLKIISTKLDKRLPIIKNRFSYKNYSINFTSIKRPFVKNKYTKANLPILKFIKKIKKNVLLIGASQGIGKDFLNLISKNKNITIIATYFKNQIELNKKKLIKKKIDITKDYKILKNLIDKYSPIKVYYFASSKILFDQDIPLKKIKELNNYFLNYPLKVLKQNKTKIFSFFYPSTDFINFNKKAPYSKIKKKAEKEIKKFCDKNNIKFAYHRFPAINSRQSVSISNPQNQNLNQYLNKNKKIVSKILL